ncbi:hypothetical protein NVP1158O_46 [Vibrio phage 1.158.O._10N.261.45.E12]|nr:hypothetical protein NVP1158O_46 [Vibrio phage 1.158.O._10N.261.45.E12]AUR92675.1 hypothetical protein NVP1175O_47 [Vibrio phage 1.175.O._10N.261.55.B3]
MKISDEIKRRYPQSMRDMCEQEYARKSIRLAESKVIYTFTDSSTIELTPNQDDIDEAE